MNPVEKTEERNGSREVMGGEVGPARDGVAPKVPVEGKLCTMVGENNVRLQASAAARIASVAEPRVLQAVRRRQR